MMAKYDELNPPALRRLLANGTKLHGFSPAIMEACFKAAQGTAQRDRQDECELQEGLRFDERLHQATAYQWFQVAELNYDSFMIRHSHG